MELWIRSQDKGNLVKSKRIEITCTNDKCYELWENEATFLGEYKTIERALEVLDEIEKLLRPQIIIQQHTPVGEIDGNLVYKSEDFKCDIQEIPTVVYQMPKE